MKKLNFVLLGALMLLFYSCTNSNVRTALKDANNPAVQLHLIDSILNCGELLHIDIYEIGELKSIEVSVQSVQVGDISLQYINFRKDCSDSYRYHSWEEAKLTPAECPYLLSAIDTIKANFERTTDHEERYAYITKDDIRLLSFNKGGDDWTSTLSVDYKKDNSRIYFGDEEDFDSLRTLIQNSLNKIDELNKK